MLGRKPGGADEGSTLRVEATASNGAGSDTATSAESVLVVRKVG